MTGSDKFAANSKNAPPHLVDTLLASDMKADGVGWFSYQMPEGWPHKWVVRIPRTAHRSTKPLPSKGPKVAHYLCFSLQCRVPILSKFIVPLSEQFRAAANFHLCKVYGERTPSFALFGHERPPDAKGDHQHAFYIPMAKEDDESGFLSDLHIWCPYGLTQAEIEILLRINRLNWGSGRYPVRPVLTALSKEPPSDAPFSAGKTKSKLWRSASPFVPPRYFYRREGNKVTLKEKDRPERQLAHCLKAAGISVPGEIRRYPLVNGEMRNDKPHWEIVRAELGEENGASLVSVPVHRNSSNKQRSMEQRVGMFFEIEFEAPVSLPIPALGHSSHFGLGLFVPAVQTVIDR
jgi:CRISPR-associated protein Csb2